MIRPTRLLSLDRGDVVAAVLGRGLQHQSGAVVRDEIEQIDDPLPV
jgi:hypothetical protein